MLFFLSNRQLKGVLDGKSSQEYQINAGVPQGVNFGPTHFLLYINDLPDDAIFLSMLMILHFYSKCDLIHCKN